jgi:hypothetical protein
MTLASVVLTLAGVQGAWLGAYAIYAFLIAGAMHLSWTRMKERDVALEVDEHGVFVDRVLLRPRAQLTKATILPRAGKGPMVELRGSLGVRAMRVALQDADSARAFVRALGLDAREGLTRFRVPFVGSDVFSIYVTAAVLLCSLVFVILPMSMGVLASLAIAAAAIGLAHVARRTVTIGADGVLVESALNRRFYPYSAIRAIHRMDAGRTPQGWAKVSPGFDLVLHTKARVRVHTIHERMREGLYEGDHLFDVAHGAHAAWTAGGGTAVTLLRGERSVTAWLRDLRKTEVGYRANSVGPDQLLSIALDAAGDEEARAAAAVALLTSDEGAREKLRIGVEEIAAPRVRASITAALNDDDETLEQTLDEISSLKKKGISTMSD